MNRAFSYHSAPTAALELKCLPNDCKVTASSRDTSWGLAGDENRVSTAFLSSARAGMPAEFKKGVYVVKYSQKAHRAQIQTTPW